MKEKHKKFTYANIKKSVKRHIADILILHGMDNDLVNDLILLGNSIGFKTSTVLGLPSYRLTQNEKVINSIKRSNYLER
ncbi:MAG: hypothetical protein JWN78_420 [Bacteroidota bacterium]|nr:hypothetical protein [Bacteroidota bacterium]